MQGKDRGELYQLWAIQESLLQAYRGIFIGSLTLLTTGASVLMAFGAGEGGAGVPIKPAVALLCVLGLYLCFIWWRVTSARGRLVTFSQCLIVKHECDIDVSRPLHRLAGFRKERAPQQRAWLKGDPAAQFLGGTDPKGRARDYIGNLPLVFGAVLLVLLYLLSRT